MSRSGNYSRSYSAVEASATARSAQQYSCLLARGVFAVRLAQQVPGVSLSSVHITHTICVFWGGLLCGQVRLGHRRRHRLQLLQRVWDGGGVVVCVLPPHSAGLHAGRVGLVERRPPIRRQWVSSVPFFSFSATMGEFSSFFFLHKRKRFCLVCFCKIVLPTAAVSSANSGSILIFACCICLFNRYLPVVF